MRKLKVSAPYLAMLILCLLGLGFFAVPGYRFTGFVCFALAAVILAYQLLYLLDSKKPNTSKILRRIFTVLLCLFLLAYAITGVIIIGASFGSADASCDYLIVLGAGVNGTVPSLSLRERLDTAYTYLQQHPETTAILSGGQGSGEDITEAECMYRYLTAAGIPEKQLIKEERATSTQENLQFSLALMERTQSTVIGILSSEYHLCRAKLMAQDQGIDPILIPAKTTWLSLRMNYYMREVAGVWYYMILGGQHHDFSFLCGPLLGASSAPAFH